jgi:hypothetical protein
MKKENLTSTQKGVIAEHIVADELMIETDGRFSPFSPQADDEGIDLLIYDKKTGKALPVQIKSRTGGIIRKGKESNTIHFEIRSVSLKNEKYAYFLAILLSKDIRSIERAWFIPIKDISTLLNIRKKQSKYIMRANKNLTTKDKFSKYQCENMIEVTKRIEKIIENKISYQR